MTSFSFKYKKKLPKTKLTAKVVHGRRIILSLLIGFVIGYKWHGKYHRISREIKCAQQNNQRFTAFSEHENVDEKSPKIFIGVMSMTKNIESRIQAALDTWLCDIDGIKVEVFSENDGIHSTVITDHEKMLTNKIKLVHLQDVKDTFYPPLKKSFKMLKYIHDRYLESFDWFIRLDDDSYVKLDKLRSFLSRINSKKLLMIGSPGYGRNEDDLITKSENYCMGGPGVIFSQALLRQIAPQLQTCIHTVYTDHEDIELSRCVNRIANVKCTESWDTRSLFYQNFKPNGGYNNNIKSLQKSEREKAITFHANKDSVYQYRLHLNVLKDKIQNLFDRISELKIELKKETLEGKNELQDQIIWGNLQYKTYRNPISPMPSSIMRKSCTDFVENIKGQVEKTKSIYSRVNPFEGFEVFTTALKNGFIRKRSETFKMRKKFLNSTFIPIFEAEILNQNELHEIIQEETIYFIMALSGRSNNLIRFLDSFSNTFLKRQHAVALVITYFSHGENDFNEDASNINEIIQKYIRVYPNFKATVVLADSNQTFSRGRGLQMGVESLTNHNSLMFFCDVDLVFEEGLITRIRRNTIKGIQVYYPVFFSQYDRTTGINKIVQKNVENRQLTVDNGFWRSFSYGMVSIYKCDFERTPGFDLSIEGWGLEDLNLLSEIQSVGLNVFKSNDLALFHPFHPKICDPRLTPVQLKSCQNSRAQHLASQRDLANKWFSDKM